MQLIIFLLLFFSDAFASSWKDLHIVNGCRIFSMTGKNLRNFPGKMCLFQENGDLITASDTHIRLISPDNEVKWEVKGYFHHQMNFSEDKKRILTFTSRIVDTPKGPRLSDVLYIMEAKSGKILHEAVADKLLEQSKIEFLHHDLSPENIAKFSVEQEISHFNSIYEIPKLKNPNVPSYLKEGNLIVNGINTGVLILSPDMSQVLHKLTFPQSHFHRVHDVQVKTNGDYLFFNNVNYIPGRPNLGRIKQGPGIEKYYSTIVEVDPFNLKTKFEFGSNPRGMFFSLICGSVQEIRDVYVFSHYLLGTYVYSKKLKDLVATIPGTHSDEERVLPSQQTKAEDLTKFLQLWK